MARLATLKISVIVPAWNEAGRIGKTLSRLRETSDRECVELVVADGGSTDATREEAARLADRVLKLGAPGRGPQMRAGAEAASGEFLFFLHSDGYPPADWFPALNGFWAGRDAAGASAAVFTVDYGPEPLYRWVAWGQNRRVRRRQVAYGDAGLCVPRRVYDRAGGMPAIPLMEDVVFSRRLGALGRIALLPQRIRPEARRLRANGPVWNSVLNWRLRVLFDLGYSPEDLWRKYYHRPDFGKFVKEL